MINAYLKYTQSRDSHFMRGQNERYQVWETLTASLRNVSVTVANLLSCVSAPCGLLTTSVSPVQLPPPPPPHPWCQPRLPPSRKQPSPTPAITRTRSWSPVEFDSRKISVFYLVILARVTERMTLQPPVGTGSTSTEPAPFAVVQTLWETETT